ncbi:Putative Phage-related protein [Candidatus Glomeribacter gigasporarum BEG34]|uniref:Putative Phage-related protein n=1 Tax=Candidatus Glomeribacter gigasporarum BEG34 TaxID=1070319 RepID=G2J870_9BURK|nr:DUF1640 domain-containing protein [Candidatus Glomeribacter gigasporarum]CCD28967.1 Putative Phage-related protein [Candidatus Glomeribacter gigasporarum BEG34]
MALPAFDTLRVANRLKAVGVPSAQAEAEAEVLSEVFEVNLKELATKEDLRATKEDLRREIGDLRKDMDAKFAGVDAKFAGVDAKLAAMEERSDAKHESLRKDMDAKHESLRKDMELMAARFEKRLLILGVTLGSITLFGQNALSTLLRLFQ